LLPLVADLHRKGGRRNLLSRRRVLVGGATLAGLLGLLRSTEATGTKKPARRSNGVHVASLPVGLPQPSDPSLLALVTKQRALAPTYQPSDLVIMPAGYVSAAAAERLRQAAADALVQMLAAVRQDGLDIQVNSAYRSYDTQAAVFQAEVATDGCTQALRESALPGHSEHQLGLAVDLTSRDVGWGLDRSFGQTPEGRWLVLHMADYGYVLTYPQGKETITGYEYEPWHFRYVTRPFAKAIVASGKTSTEYLQALGTLSGRLTKVTPPAEAGPSAATAVMVVNTDALRLRATPDLNGRIEATMPQGSLVRVTGPANANKWQAVIFNGMAGWCDATYLSVLSPGAVGARTTKAC
jgi:zinc D-Ala-D-Ala carboxypeptidase